MKVKAEIFKGIEFVEINKLPEEQRAKFLESFNRNSLIKILIDGKIIRNCAQYSDYELWFEDVFGASPVIRNGPVQTVGNVPVHRNFQSQIPVSGTTSRTLPAESSK